MVISLEQKINYKLIHRLIELKGDLQTLFHPFLLLCQEKSETREAVNDLEPYSWVGKELEAGAQSLTPEMLSRLYRSSNMSSWNPAQGRKRQVRSDHRADLFGNKSVLLLRILSWAAERFWSLFWKVFKERLDKCKYWMIEILTRWKDKISLAAFPEL